MPTTRRVLLAALLLTFCLSAQSGRTTPTIGPTSPTTIGPYSPPHKLGVPDWVYTNRISPDLRIRFEVLYEMLNQRLGYQPSTVALNFQKLAEQLGDIGSSGAVGTPNTIPESVWHLDDSDQIKWLQDRIRFNVKESHLEDIARSEDLVPSLRAARPTTIGPATQGPRQLTPVEAGKLLTPAAKDAAKPVGSDKKADDLCVSQYWKRYDQCWHEDGTAAISACMNTAGATLKTCSAAAKPRP